jgi:type II secretory pathway component PulM
MDSGAGLFLSIAMIGVFVLAGGGAWMMKRDRKRGMLMIGVAVVLLANVLILVWPTGR